MGNGIALQKSFCIDVTFPGGKDISCVKKQISMGQSFITCMEDLE